MRSCLHSITGVLLVISACTPYKTVVLSPGATHPGKCLLVLPFSGHIESRLELVGPNRAAFIHTLEERLRQTLPREIQVLTTFDSVADCSELDLETRQQEFKYNSIYNLTISTPSRCPVICSGVEPSVLLQIERIRISQRSVDAGPIQNEQEVAQAYAQRGAEYANRVAQPSTPPELRISVDVDYAYIDNANGAVSSYGRTEVHTNLSTTADRRWGDVYSYDLPAGLWNVISFLMSRAVTEGSPFARTRGRPAAG